MGNVTSSERDHRTRREHFPISGQWWPWIYLAQIWRHGASKILESRVWFLRVTWRHLSRDHWIGICGFLLAVHWNHASILHRYADMGPQRYWGHDLDLLGSCEVIGQVTIGLGVGTFLLVVNDDHALILHGYGYAGVHWVAHLCLVKPMHCGVEKHRTMFSVHSVEDAIWWEILQLCLDLHWVCLHSREGAVLGSQTNIISIDEFARTSWR